MSKYFFVYTLGEDVPYNEIMSEAFLKSIKWVFAVLCVVLGMYGFHAAEQAGNVKPLAFCVAGFGMAYMMSNVWKKTAGKISLMGAVAVLVLAFIARLEVFGVAVFMVSGIDITNSFFAAWSVLIVIVGVPLMTILLRYFD